jgi:hypothetical protein
MKALALALALISSLAFGSQTQNAATKNPVAGVISQILTPQNELIPEENFSLINYWRVHFINRCSDSIRTWIHYRDFNNEWITEGVWHHSPGESKYVANTRNGIIYLYAENMSGSIVWNGDYNFYDNYGNLLPMRKFTINGGYGDYRRDFTCE